ncbi:hypothetical protein ACRE_024940 [Hapsidospora chrysogenum ATCC 11550]|uniref:Uncharacterized protein n=1 Tax=Hapsidospora chrysogenum (strain ATCC 11550 / CBS 779.69 / DSM 880 / IAM 14645 / JCM 23072 / IMI 49137) TaxID=857340 RepID=A0A086TBC4_HAPC1|nr:hypothetical protein ACRE_024940 [Hapsidospora chrysogenum ATCC 11550]
MHGYHEAPQENLTMLPNTISQDRKQDQCDVSAVYRLLPIDPLGIFILGKDGVMRSLTADRGVPVAIPLPPRLIKAHLDRVEHDKELETHFRGVDGAKAPREHWFRPHPEILPPPLAGERLEEAKQLMEEMRVDSSVKPGTDSTEDGEVLEGSICPVIVMSDHDILGKEG